jgi:hypothetical protein
MSNDIVQRLMAFEACHANEDAEMALDAAKEITSLRAAQSRHEAEREALESSLAVTQAMLQDNEQAVAMLKEEREALVNASKYNVEHCTNPNAMQQIAREADSGSQG